MKTSNLFLGAITVQDSAALIGKRKLVSILQVRPINLTELQDNERSELTNQYRYFLRSLTFPIQIVLRFANKDSDKSLYRKRMADVEEIIKKAYKKNSKEVLVESDAFKNWLKLYLEMHVRPMLLCYMVIPVNSETDLSKNKIAYVEALQLLNQRTNDCISRLSSVRIKKRLNNNSSRSEWEENHLKTIQEKKAMIALNMFKRKANYYSLDNSAIINNGQRKINDFIKSNFYDQIIAESEISLDIKRLDDNEIIDLFDSYCKDFIALNKAHACEYLSMKELFSLMNKPMEKEAVE